jgi:hypothetical protein
VDNGKHGKRHRECVTEIGISNVWCPCFLTLTDWLGAGVGVLAGAAAKLGVCYEGRHQPGLRQQQAAAVRKQPSST